MVNHSYIIVSIVYLYCHVKNRCALIHFACMVLCMCMCFFHVFIMVFYMCILSFVCLYYAFMYVTLLVGGNKEYLLYQHLTECKARAENMKISFCFYKTCICLNILENIQISVSMIDKLDFTDEYSVKCDFILNAVILIDAVLIFH